MEYLRLHRVTWCEISLSAANSMEAQLAPCFILIHFSLKKTHGKDFVNKERRIIDTGTRYIQRVIGAI